MNPEQMIRDYRRKYPVVKSDRNVILCRRYIFKDPVPDHETLRRGVKLELSTRYMPDFSGTWFDDMKVLVAKLRLAGVEVTWPEDKLP